MLVLSATGVANIVVFREKAQSLLKLVNDNDDSDIDVSIKKLAGEIVKEIKTVDCDKTQYSTRLHRETAGPRSAVGNVSDYRCVSDCRSRGREFDPGPVPYFCGD